MVVIVLQPGTVQPVETLKVLLSSVLQGTNATGKAKTSKNENKKKKKKKTTSKNKNGQLLKRPFTSLPNLNVLSYIKLF